MPTVSKKQAKFMRAAAHDPKFAARNKIQQSVAREFVIADADDKKKAAGGRKPAARRTR